MMNIMITKKLYSKFILLTLVAMLTACAGDNTKSSAEDASSKQTKSSKQTVTKSDRDKYRIGITALNNNELSKAQRIFNEFIRNKPRLAGAYSNLALVHYKKNEFDKSFKLVNKALELNPKQAQALNLRAQIYILNGKIHKAKDDYLRAVSIKPKYKNAQYNLALLYDIYFQEINLAIKHYKIYLSLQKKKDESILEWVKHLEGTLKDV